MAEGFTKQSLKMVVSQICQTIGWHAIQTTSLEVLIDVLHRYLDEIAKTAHLYADQFGRTRPNLDDLGLAFSAMGIEIRELDEYVDYVDSVPSLLHVPKYPVPKESHLNFLKPGSKEVVTRPVHVHEHLPPTLPDAHPAPPKPPPPLPLPLDAPKPPAPAPDPDGFKRPGDPPDAPPPKRARLFLEEEGRPLREISSVMMTTGGFLSPAREGKLPEPKVVLPTADSRALSPPPPCYPAVPPDVNREKKPKKPDAARPDRKDRRKPDRTDPGDEPAIKKLASMKETDKLRALKTGALKMAARYAHLHKPPKPGSNKLPDHPPEKSLIQKLSESPHLVVTPLHPNPPHRPPTPAHDPAPNDPGVTIAKLTTEPDSQKLNIFKKITKLKDDKHEPPPDALAPPPRDRSPGLIIEEVARKPRAPPPDPPKPLPRTPDAPYDDPLSSPGSPSTPKTPDILRKSPDHKKKKKDKDRKRKKTDPRPRPDDAPPAPPKTPDAPSPSPSPAPAPAPSPSPAPAPSPVLSFFPHFPAAPGLIPPPISNPLIPRFPHPLCPNFPNLPLPPPILMHHPLKPDDKLSPSFSPVKSDKEGKSPLAILLNRDKEKKAKDHKKEKKDRDKLKKKKDKKEKLRKAEKKHREDKYKEHKSKEKREKKRKEKLKDAAVPMVVSVPKLTLKLGPSSPRPPSPDPKPKPPPRDDPPRREPTPDIARISSLFSKPSKTPLTKPLHVHTDHPKPSALAPKDAAPLMKSPGTIIDKDGNKVWICPACGRPDDGSAMIGCDECDAWYHWVCVGIQVPPDKNEDWYCRFCIVKKQGTHTEKKKRGRKKKPPM